MEIKDNIRRYRKERGMTQIQLAQAVGVNVYAVKCWESGKYEPTVKSLKELCKVFEVSANILCGLDEPSEPAPQVDMILETSTGRTAFIDEVMTMPEDRFRRILKYSEFLKKEAPDP